MVGDDIWSSGDDATINIWQLQGRTIVWLPPSPLLFFFG
jgi:hypothetical protein